MKEVADQSTNTCCWVSLSWRRFRSVYQQAGESSEQGPSVSSCTAQLTESMAPSEGRKGGRLHLPRGQEEKRQRRSRFLLKEIPTQDESHGRREAHGRRSCASVPFSSLPLWRAPLSVSLLSVPVEMALLLRSVYQVLGTELCRPLPGPTPNTRTPNSHLGRNAEMVVFGVGPLGDPSG